MARTTSADRSRADFAWRHYHPHHAEDPRAAFAAGVHIGLEQMLDDSARWLQLAPLLGDLLEEPVPLREDRDVEREIIESDLRPAF